MTGNPQTDVEARLRQLRDEIDAILDGDESREVNGRTVGDLSDINGVLFGLSGRDRADVRVTQEPADPPAPLIRMLGEALDGSASVYGYPPRAIAGHAVDVMEASRDSDEYEREASTSTTDE